VLLKPMGFSLGARSEVYELNDDTGLFTQTLNFSIHARHVGKLVRLSLTNICCANADRTMEWPREKMMITATRTTDGIEVATEERIVEGRDNHTLSSFYIRGVEKINVQCEFMGDGIGKHTIVMLVFDPSRQAESGGEGRGGGGGGGGGEGGGGGGGEGGGGGSSSSRRHASLSSGAKSSRYEEGGASAGQKRTDRSNGDGPGYSQRVLHKGIGPNCILAVPDQREMIELLAAQAASEQEASLHDISRLQCPKCQENEDKHMCCVCQEQVVRVIFQPCMHLVCCEKCGKNDRLVNCPICRGKIEKRSVVYGTVP